jgi:Alpha/beta hydrolase domain
VPFARTKAERLASGDPRPSLEERYGNQEAYVQRIKEVVCALQDARLLLPEDAARFVDEAAARNLFAP